ncbi:MAG: fumarate hydratase [Candidatus Omnitrophica bacterium]|nr:fumarate hydratase [Candidatus Omnitrophota bacterium]
MKKISSEKIIAEVAKLVERTAYRIPAEVKTALMKSYRAEKAGSGKKYLGIILENLMAAEKERLPICQDTGLAVFFVELGCDVIINTGRYRTIEDIINEGLRRGSKNSYLRRSIVSPVERKNTGTNAPGVIHLLPGEKGKLEITLLAKGFGSENTSRLAMLSPNSGKEGIEEFIIETVRQAGSLPCPPIFVGAGIGGSFEKAALLSKIALCRMGGKSPYRKWEKFLVKKLNSLKIGPAGFGGKTTALDVRIETFPTHIAGLPVAVNISCWAHRTGTVTL